MTNWPKSTMETFYSWNKPSDTRECEVVIVPGRISISYRDDSGWITYAGEEQGTGHYKVTSKELSGRASLHRFGDEDTLEGSWHEDGSYGTWRIELDDGRED